MIGCSTANVLAYTARVVTLAQSGKSQPERVTTLYLIRVSFLSIRLTVDAADAAKRNLVLLTDSYPRGIKSIIDLIDAQNQSLVADQQAANAVYDFLIDLMSVQRSVGKFFFFAEEEDRQAFMDRLDQFMQSYGILPTRG